MHARPSWQSVYEDMELPYGSGSVWIKGWEGIADPALFVRARLADAARDTWGMQVVLDESNSDADAEIAKLLAAHPDADYVLDVETLRWSITAFDSKWKGMYADYHGRVRLIEATSARVVADDECLLSTQDHQHRPLRKMFEYNDAKLAKDVFASMGWGCSHIIARDGLRLTDGAIPAIPADMIDPVGVFMTPRPAAPPATR